MKTIETQVFMFDELSDKAKEKARDWYREGQDNSWPWETARDDASQIGLELKELQTCRSSSNNGSFIKGAVDCANAIVENHGSDCETYKTAKAFLLSMDSLNIEYPEGSEGDYGVSDYEGEKEELEEDFLQSILEDYRIMLEKDCEYQNSDEVVDETMTANEYTFTVDGRRFG